MASFPQPRPRMPGADPDGALRALKSMQGVTNVGSLTNQGLDIAQGLGDFQPSEQDLMGAQHALTRYSPEGSFVTPSRESIRESAMGRIKQMLRMQQVEQAQKLELGQQKIDAETQARTAQNEAIAARQREMAEMNQAAREAAREDAQAHAAMMQDERLAAQGPSGGGAQRLPTEGMDKRLSDARAQYQGGWNSFVRKLPGGFDGGRQQYQGALESVLTRTGSLGALQKNAKEAQAAGMNAAAAIQEAANQGVTLDPYEKQYLELLLGS